MKKLILVILLLSGCGKPGITGYDLEVFFNGDYRLFQNDTSCNYLVERDEDTIVVTNNGHQQVFEDLDYRPVQYGSNPNTMGFKLGNWYLIKLDDRYIFDTSETTCMQPI